MNVGIIGYGSMGKMLADKFAASGILDLEDVFVTNRSKEKLESAPIGVTVCENNRELAVLGKPSQVGGANLYRYGSQGTARGSRVQNREIEDGGIFTF